MVVQMSLQARLRSVETQVLAEKFLVYASSNCTAVECQALAGRADGLVVKQANRTVLNAAKSSGFSGLVLLDPAEYERRTGPSETIVQSLLGQSDAISIQQEAEVDAYLSPSGYIPDGDVGLLMRVIEDGAIFCAETTSASHVAPAFIVLPVGSAWLSRDSDRRVLIATAQACGYPIAIVLGSDFDPLSSRTAVIGLIDFVSAVNNVLLLRADLNSIGGVALGALCAAIGVGTAGRHFRPPDTRPKRRGATTDKSPSTLWIPGGSFHRGSLFEHSYDDQGLLNCACAVCDGRHLRRFGDPASRPESRLHSVAGWYQIAQNLIAHDPEDRPKAWQARCEMAVDATKELRRRTQVDYRSPTAQIWKSVLG